MSSFSVAVIGIIVTIKSLFQCFHILEVKCLLLFTFNDSCFVVQYADWDSGRTHIYHCYVSADGRLNFKVRLFLLI